ncbi:hypothetical protein Prudu_005423, partial [Prunus dulcis]
TQEIRNGGGGFFSPSKIGRKRSRSGAIVPLFLFVRASAAPIMTKIIKVAAVCGSLREASYNRCLIRSVCIIFFKKKCFFMYDIKRWSFGVVAIEISKTSIDGLEIEYVDISALPFLNVDLEGKDGSFPPAVEAFPPKYNYSISAPLKNAIDWASNAWADKAAAVVSASGDFGGGRSQYHLRQVGVSLDLHFINKPEFFLDGLKSPEKFDSGNLVDEQDKERLKEILWPCRHSL